jgi:Na+/H+-translocating membrane pyrophosphatase
MANLDRNRPVAMIAVAFTGVTVGAALGALTNAINGRVSPLYFRNIMGWDEVENVWRASIAQGILEGLLFGLVFAVIFICVVGIVSKARCPYPLAAVYLVLIAVCALVCWAIGGLIGMGLATLSPEFYRHTFRGVPEGFNEMLRYAWVGGSIWGIEFGGLAFLIVGSVLFRAKWRHLQEETEVAEKTKA